MLKNTLLKLDDIILKLSVIPIIVLDTLVVFKSVYYWLYYVMLSLYA